MTLSKKSGSIVKIVAFVAGIAAVGTACYVYKDKIKEFLEKNDVKGKLNQAKDFVSDKLSKNSNEDYFDDAEFFDDDVEEDTSNRGYTSITITSGEDSEDSEREEEATPAAEAVKEAAAPVEEKVTIPVEDADSKEEAPEGYEYEGLSDVSEDEDVLADEAALDGVEF
jgi:hypothetical protein